MFKSSRVSLVSALALLSLTLFSGCTTLDELTGKVEAVKKESTEAAENLKNEAVRVQTDVKTKVQQVNTAVDSVNTAVKSVDQAVKDVKTVTK